MSIETTGLDAFLSRAIAVLDQTERELQGLADEALSQVNLTLGTTTNGHDRVSDEDLVRLRWLGQQFEGLVERSVSLKGQLENGLTLLPGNEPEWPRIKLLQSQEEERTQLARELERSVGQLLANAVFELAAVRHTTSINGRLDPEALAGLSALQDELENGLAQVRQLIEDLEPATLLGDFGLMAGLRRYLERFERRTGLLAELQVKTNIDRLPSTVEISIFRVIQEALLNIERHAGATRVLLSAAEKDDELVFTIIDDGTGFNPDKFSNSGRRLGLVQMQDYADILKGQLRIRSAEQGGTEIILAIPYPMF